MTLSPLPATVLYPAKDASASAGSSSKNDPVNHPAHYTSHPSGIETIEITRHLSFNLGNSIKYILRSPYKGRAIEDLQKAVWYLNDQIRLLQSPTPYEPISPSNHDPCESSP
jgi:hypothetical protein